MRILFVVLWILAAAMLHLFGNNVGTFVVLMVSIVVPVICGILVLVVPFTPTMSVNQTVSLAILYRTPPFLLKTTCTLTCTNTFTGQIDTTAFPLPKQQNPFTIETNHCGAIHITAANFQISDPLDLFTRKLNHTLAHSYVIPPTSYKLDIPIPDTITSPDSDDYSTTKAGMDVSEIFAIREYQPGDPIRSIHWKLSEKIDKTMVREFGLPVANSILLVFGEAPAGEEVTHDGWHASAKMYYSATLAFIENDVNVTMAWQTKDGLYEFEIRNQDDAHIAIKEFLLTVTKTPLNTAVNSRPTISIIPGNTPTMQ